MTKRIQIIDILRAVAVLGVVIDHAFLEPSVRDWSGRAGAWVTQIGSWGVPLFFVLSGFCIHLKAARSNVENSSAKTYHVAFWPFWKRRMWRLYPAYVVALIIAFAVEIGLGNHLWDPTFAANPRYWMSLNFMAHLLMLHGLIPAFDCRGFYAAFWSLAREEYLYLMYFLFLFLLRRTTLLKTLLWVCVISALLTTLSNVYVTLSPLADSKWLMTFVISSAWALWPQWVLGAVAAELFALKQIPRFFTNVGLALTLFVFILTVMVFTNTALNNTKPEWQQYLALPIPQTLLGIAFFVLLLCALSHSEYSSRSSTNKIPEMLEKIGARSYSIYLVHLPLQALLWNHNPTHPMLWALVLVSVAIVGGCLFFQLVERYFVNSPKPCKVATS